MVKQKTKFLQVALSKQVIEMLQEIKDDLWHWQVLKVNKVGNFINLFFFKWSNFGNLIPKFFESLQCHHSSNITFFMY